MLIAFEAVIRLLSDFTVLLTPPTAHARTNQPVGLERDRDGSVQNSIDNDSLHALDSDSKAPAVDERQDGQDSHPTLRSCRFGAHSRAGAFSLPRNAAVCGAA